MSDNTQEKGNKSGSMKGLIIGLAIGLVVAIIAIVAVLNLGKGNTTETEPETNKKAVVTADNVEEVVEDFLNDDEPLYIPQKYTVTQNSEWHFPDGDSESEDAYVENVKGNESPVYFNVILNDTEEVVYSSPILELGASLSGLKLDKHLEAGIYEVTIEYHLVDDQQRELTTVNVGGTIVIEG